MNSQLLNEHKEPFTEALQEIKSVRPLVGSSPDAITVLQFDGSICKESATIKITALENVTSGIRSACPQVILRLLPVPQSHVPSLASSTGVLDLTLPKGMTSSNRGGAQTKCWLRAQPCFASEAAKVAWAAADASEIAQSLKELARSDPGFLNVLAEVATSVAAPIGAAGFTSSLTCCYKKTYVPAGALALIPAG